MKAIAVGLLSLALLGLSSFGSDARTPDGPVIRLAPVRVRAGAFSVNYKWDEQGMITSVRVTLVRAQSPGEKAGLRAGDQLVRIDGRAVVGMPHEELAAILAAELTPAHPTEIYSFEGKRFLDDDVKVNWKFSYNPDEKSRTDR